MKAVVETMKVAIIGCTHAGIAAMKQILKYYPGTEITVYERHADISYMSCGTYLHLGVPSIIWIKRCTLILVDLVNKVCRCGCSMM